MATLDLPSAMPKFLCRLALDTMENRLVTATDEQTRTKLRARLSLIRSVVDEAGDALGSDDAQFVCLVAGGQFDEVTA